MGEITYYNPPMKEIMAFGAIIEWGLHYLHWDYTRNIQYYLLVIFRTNRFWYE